MKKFLPALLGAGLVLGFSYNVFTNSSGAPSGVTSGLGSPTCAMCHTGPVGTGSGTISIQGNPATYNPGQTYTVNISVTDPGCTKFGFASRIIDINQNAAGTIASTSSETQIIPGTNPQEITHTRAGTSTTTPGSKRWSYSWTAPASTSAPDSVYIGAAMNASNADNRNSGDRIYSANFIFKKTSPNSSSSKSLENGNVFFNAEGLNIQLFPQLLEEQALEVIDMSGKVVYRAHFGVSSLPIQKVVALNVPEGIYSVIYRHGNQIESISLKK
jgi:hypothetical protein